MFTYFLPKKITRNPFACSICCILFLRKNDTNLPKTKRIFRPNGVRAIIVSRKKNPLIWHKISQLNVLCTAPCFFRAQLPEKKLRWNVCARTKICCFYECQERRPKKRGHFFVVCDDDVLEMSSFLVY